MRTKPDLSLYVVLLFTFIIIALPKASAQNGIEGRIAEPVFVTVNSYGDPAYKDSIYINFNSDRNSCRKKYGNRYYKVCRPRLELDGQTVTSGITMTPDIKGEWRWNNDYQLQFTPEGHWPADTRYTITLDLDRLGVPDRVLIDSDKRAKSEVVTTKPLHIDILNMSYMQDPDNPARKLVTAELDANYPVIPETLRKRINLLLEQAEGDTLVTGDENLDHELTIRPDSMHANLAVPIKELPDQEHYLRLSIPVGVAPEFGGQDTKRTFTERARVPSLETYLDFNDIAAVIARDESGTPEQILSLETNVKAAPKELYNHITAYLLPRRHPVTARGKKSGEESDKPYEWKAANEVTSSILEQAEKLALRPTETEDEQTRFGFGFDAPEGRYLYVEIAKGLEAFGGYTLESGTSRIVKVPDHPHDIEIMQDGSILTLGGAQKLSLHARGTDKLAIKVAQIRPAALNHFIAQTRGDIRSPTFKHWSFDKENIAVIDEKTVPMAYENPAVAQYAAFNFAPYLKDGRKGIFLLDIQGYKDGKQVGNAERRFVLVSDLGLLVKKNADNSRNVFLASFSEGTPVKGATINVLSRNGLGIFEGKTDKDGHIELPDFSGFEADRQPVVITAQNGKDFSFIPYERRDRVLNNSRFDTGGNRIQPDGLNAYLFTDRGIYRPGETVHIGAIVKNADWQALPPTLPLKAVIRNARGRIVKETLINFEPPGLEEITLETAYNDPTGAYNAGLYIADDGEQGAMLGNISFRVEEFTPDRLKINTGFMRDENKITRQEGWLKPDDLALFAELDNLYGTPASNRKVTAKAQLYPAALSFNRYPDYKFFDSYAAKQNVSFDLPATQTDSEGFARITLPLDRQEKATYTARIETTGYEAGSGKGVTAYANTLISPMDFVVGYKSKANLGYLEKGEPYSAQLIALDPALDRISTKNLTISFIRKNYVSTLIKRPDGSYVYESVPKEETIKTTDITIPEDGHSLTLPTHETGNYLYRLKNSDGLVIAEIPFSVAGEEQRDKGLDREAVLHVKTDKESYETGDTINLQITAPYTGAGLITLESDKVIARKWFRTDKTETVQSITIPDDFAGKGYVNIAFVRDVNSQGIYMNPLSHAIVPFTAGTGARESGIEISAPAMIAPGKDVTVTYKGAHKGKAIIFAVDEGILQVAGHETPDPVAYFLLNRALQVETSQMLDLLMPEFDIIKKLSAYGGGAALKKAAVGQHLNPFRRETLAPAVFWSRIVDLDTDEKTVTFTPPGHFNGQMRIMAVAVGEDRVGSAQQDITVRSDIVMTPNTPLFMAPDDKAIGSITIANQIKNSGADATATLDFKTEGGLTVVEAPDPVTVPYGEERNVTFTVRATDDLGPANLIINATIGETTQSAESTLSIRPPVAKETILASGYAEDGNARMSVPRDLYPAFAAQSLSVSALPTPYIYGLLRYLDGFPYGCSEQIISRTFPQIALSERPEFAIDTENMREKVNKTVADLRQRQSNDGGFSLWGGGYDSHGFISVYTMDFLQSAYEKDLPVPEEMLENGLRYLRDFANRHISSLQDAREKAYAIYILTRSGVVTTNEILHFLQYFEKDGKDIKWQHDLAAVYIAASYEMMQQKELAAQTMDTFTASIAPDQISLASMSGSYPYYNDFVKYAQYVTLLARHFPERFANIDPAVVMIVADFVRTNNYNTLSSSYAIQALSSYAAKRNEEMTEAAINVYADEQSLELAGQNTGVPLNTNTIRITGDGKALFYGLTQTGYDRTIPDKPLSQGMTISRTYQTLDGAPITEPLKTGDIIEAVITVRAHDNRRIENVAVVDLLPGGLMLEDGNATNAPSSLRPEFTEKREDRLLLFATIPPRDKTYSYRLRAVSQGEYAVPPVYAESMYDLSKKARGESGTIKVVDEHNR